MSMSEAEGMVPIVSAARPLRARRCRWPALLTLLAVLSTVAQPAFSGNLSASREYQLKAAFLYNFTKFIEWPPQSFSGTSAPIVIGVLSDSPLGSELVQVVKDRNVNGRSIVVKRIETAAEARLTHLLFVGAGEGGRFVELEPAIRGSSIVTIGESPSFAQAGGTINFVLEDDKVRFEINMDSAEHAGLRISAQLQKLAKLILKRS